jgi:hypothetical protein
MNTQESIANVSPPALAGFCATSRISHTLQVRCGAGLSNWLELVSSMVDHSDAVESLQSVRKDGYFDHRIVLVGIDEQQAMDLRLRLVACDGVQRVWLEHRINRIRARPPADG